MGTVYLIHFKTPYKHAKHYIGYTKNLADRLAHHRNGTGARLLQVLKEFEIEWDVVRTWTGKRALERKLKNMKNAPKLCPVCNPKEAK